MIKSFRFFFETKKQRKSISCTYKNLECQFQTEKFLIKGIINIRRTQAAVSYKSVSFVVASVLLYSNCKPCKNREKLYFEVGMSPVHNKSDFQHFSKSLTWYTSFQPYS